MTYTELKYVNDLGGIQAEREDGVTVYLAPSTDEHKMAVEGAFGPIAAYEPPPPETRSAADVKAEARRRIIAVADEDKQRNLTAQAIILAEKGRANWTADELAAWEAGQAVWEEISAIRSASNAIEAMDPIPDDLEEDKHWP